jgi:glyoxylase-like metal-dependent hydrolase (beta-lactamase superfamily II)
MRELKLAPATTTIAGPVTYRYGELEVQLIPNAPAHTWGDVMVYVPARRLLFAGDIAFSYVTPPAHNGHVTKWIEAIDRIMKMDVDAIVPGHGPVGSKSQLADTRAYLDLIANEARKRYAMGMSPGRAAADIDLGSSRTGPIPNARPGTWSACTPSSAEPSPHRRTPRRRIRRWRNTNRRVARVADRRGTPHH